MYVMAPNTKRSVSLSDLMPLFVQTLPGTLRNCIKFTSWDSQDISVAHNHTELITLTLIKSIKCRDKDEVEENKEMI